MTSSPDPKPEQVTWAQLRALAAASVDSIFIKDRQRRYLFVNEAMCRLFQCEAHTLLGRTPEEVFDRESARTVREVDDRTFARETVRETRELTIEGERHIFETIQRPLEEACGEVVTICGFVSDVTARVRTTEALRRSEQENRALLTALPDLMFQIGRDGTFLGCHAADPRALFAPPELFLGRQVADILPPLLAAPTLQGGRAALDTGTLQSFEYSLPLGGDPRRFEARIVACRSDSALCLVRDITEQHRTTETLAAEKERLAVTLRSIGEGVVTTDTAGGIVLLNRVAEELTGWTQAEATGRPLPEVLRLRDEASGAPLPELLAEALASRPLGGPGPRALLVARDGRERVVTGSRAPIRDHRSEVVGHVLVFRDVTRQLRLEDEVRRTQKLESLGLLAGGIAHDFNNLLTGILGHVSLARLRAEQGSPQDEWLLEAEKAIARARHLTQQLLTFSKGGAPVRKTARIDELIRDSAAFSLRGANASCEFAIAPDLWAVDIDEGQMSQVLSNLVVNADQAMPEGGTVRVRARNLPRDTALPVDLPARRYVEITISDEGKGIPEELLHRVFDPYFTTKPQGSGLGLTTSESIVRKHDGRLTVDSPPGQGATFTLYLPASPSAPLPAPHDEAVTSGRGRILVMDDEALVRDVCRQLLCHLGYEIATAVDGEEAQRLFLAAQEAGQPFDAVILDLTVPGGQGGRECVQRLRALEPDVRAIVSSGYSNDAILADHQAHGFVGVIVKPYELRTLGRVLQEVLAERAR